MGQVYSVAQINSYIRNMFAQDFMLRKISVRGEVSNCKYHSSGHIYFTIKDEKSALSCVMFAGSRRGLSFQMDNGDSVIVTGSVEVYERDGKYQMYASSITREGAGALYERFLALKAELEEMGMFAPEYKKPIPPFAKTIGIVTAATGAAVHDIETVSRRRNPGVQLVLYPAQVQGEGAAESIVRGIRALESIRPDVIIVGRGGGSIEDLWAFNEEIVARAIFECSVPVISAVGHETDVTIADFAADLRAATPSAAAELASPDIRAVLENVTRIRNRMHNAMAGKITSLRMRLDGFRTKWQLLSPASKLREKQQRLADLETRMRECMETKIGDARDRSADLQERICRAMDRRVERSRVSLQLLIGKMKGLSPLDRLNQGFSYTETASGKALKSIREVSLGDHLVIRLSDGSVPAVAEGTPVPAEYPQTVRMDK